MPPTAMLVLLLISHLASIVQSASESCQTVLNGGMRDCCRDDGMCRSSSCTVFGFKNSAKSNCQTSNNRPSCGTSTCSYVLPSCIPTTGNNHCYGRVTCSDGSTTCEGVGQLCLEDGSSSNFKICGDGATTGTQACTTWAAWSACSSDCAGTRQRSRFGNADGSNKDCAKYTTESEVCNANCNTCKFGNWGSWSTTCTSTCGSGTTMRTRAQTRGDASCHKQNTTEYRICNRAVCACSNTPGWKDDSQWTCAMYASNNMCTTGAQYGTGWTQSFGLIADRAANRPDAFASCCACGKDKCVADVMLVVDASGSIGIENWLLVMQYVQDRISLTKFTDASGNRMGVVIYSMKGNLECHLSWNKEYLLECAADMLYMDSYTATAIAIKIAGSELATYSSTSRNRAIEVLTDGGSNVDLTGCSASSCETRAKQATQAQASAQRALGVTMLAVGIGSAVDVAELNGIASDPNSDYVALLDDFDALTAFAKLISGQCTLKAVVTPSQSPRPPAHSPEPTCNINLQIPSWYLEVASSDTPSCSFETIRTLLQEYDCTTGCSEMRCDTTLPRPVLLALAGCS